MSDLLKVHLSPGPEQTKPDNGVGQVIHAQARHLPACGIELVNDPDEADVIAAHIQQGDLPRVDVLHCHGLYWTGDPNSGSYAPMHHEANARILDAARKATVISVPSAWVAEPFKRDMRISPEVIGHGIDLDALPAIARHKGYVLWNKNRDGDACSPAPALALARRGVDVVSTYGPKLDHLRVVGPQPHRDMLELVRHAEVYLATTKETFGIGTLEALAQGIPVLGYAWGGTADLITPDCGVLVEPNDVDGLIAGLAHIRANYQSMRMAARARAKRYTWRAAAERYAAIYQRAYDLRLVQQHRVAVVITNYNYAEYVGGAIYSAAMQTYLPHEIIVVDDGSTDASHEEIAGALAEVAGDFPQIITRHICQDNQGVAAARNAGIAAATSEYIVCLDADDELAPGYLAACQPALANDPGLGVAYAGLAWLHDDGPVGPNIWRGQFDWETQSKPSNPPSTTIHCAAMFRRTMWERAGGYQQIYAPAEDAEFFTRGLSVGFTARMVTDQPLFLYRNTPNSASKAKQYRPIDTWHPWMRDKAYPMAAPATKQPLVRSYSEPLISVIIPVGPGHAAKLPAAIDSLLGQTFRGWELIVVDDTDLGGFPAELHQRYPFMWTVSTDAPRSGAGAARNHGLLAARAPLVLFLDADDYLIPTALQAMLERYRQGDAGYVYSDWYSRDSAGKMTAQQSPEFDALHWLTRGACAVTALMATADARTAGGFDTALPSWEDWDFFIKLTINGVCGVRLPEPLLVYQLDTGGRRAAALANADALRGQIQGRYSAYAKGATAMARCCGGNGAAIQQIKQQLDGLPAVEYDGPAPDGKVRMEFIGPAVGAVTYYGTHSSRQYRGGNNPHDRYHDVDPQDVKHLESTGLWRVVFQPPARPPTVPISAVLAEPIPAAAPVAPIVPPAFIEDAITPEQEAEANRAAAAMVKAQRKRG